MNALDIKIDAMVHQFADNNPKIQYGELRHSANELLRVMTRAQVISFLKYAQKQREAK